MPSKSEADKEAAANDAFELGMRYVFRKQGFDSHRVTALLDVARGIATDTIKTAAHIHYTLAPHVLAAKHRK